jgi:hypothetical protein
MDKPVLMIHKIEKNSIVPKLKDFVLTFDDGLYNHFYYYPKIEEIETEKIFFVSTNIICKGKQSKKFISSEKCHKKAFEGNYEDFMNVDQISYLSTRKNVIIGGHSHFHKNLIYKLYLDNRKTYSSRNLMSNKFIEVEIYSCKNLH